MPNWVYNEVEIAAPLTEVQAYLFETDDPESVREWRTHFFNLHQLFPERFEAGDERGLKAWDYDWMLEYLGTKWNPRIDCITEVEGITHLGFDTAWCAPNELLERLHTLTGWKIVNRHDEENPDYDAVFTCENGISSDERFPGTSTCSNCEERWPSDDMDDDYGECPTCVRGRANYLVTIEPDGASFISIGESDSADLHADVVLGVFSARSERQAMLLSTNKIPAKAREGYDYLNDLEGFGLKAYKLAKTAEEEEQEEG